MEAAAQILSAIPGIELVDLGQPSVGLMSNYLRALPAYKRELQLKELEAARDAGVDALVTVYHADYRELCAHERDWPFKIVNALEVIGQSMGLSEDDQLQAPQAQAGCQRDHRRLRRPDRTARPRPGECSPGGGSHAEGSAVAACRLARLMSRAGGGRSRPRDRATMPSY